MELFQKISQKIHQGKAEGNCFSRTFYRDVTQMWIAEDKQLIKSASWEWFWRQLTMQWCLNLALKHDLGEARERWDSSVQLLKGTESSTIIIVVIIIQQYIIGIRISYVSASTKIHDYITRYSISKYVLLKPHFHLILYLYSPGTAINFREWAKPVQNSIGLLQ